MHPSHPPRLRCIISRGPHSRRFGAKHRVAARKNKKSNGVDREIDLHGYTSAEARSRLNMIWSTREWQGLQRIRVIHGTGSALYALVRLWCEEKGIEWTVETPNTGVTILHPGRRLQAESATPHRPLHPLKHHPARRVDKETVTRGDKAKTPYDPPGQSLMASTSAVDPMAEEFERLKQDDALTMFKRKRDLVPPRPAPTRARADRPKSFLPAVPPPPAPDLMAAEFARLGEEAAKITRKRKGGRD